MTQGDIERIREESAEVLHPDVLEPDEIIEVESQPVSRTRPATKVRTTEIVTRGLDLLTSIGRLVLRFLQEPDADTRISLPSVSRRSSVDRTTRDQGGSAEQGGRRRRRRRGGA